MSEYGIKSIGERPKRKPKLFYSSVYYSAETKIPFQIQNNNSAFTTRKKHSG